MKFEPKMPNVTKVMNARGMIGQTGLVVFKFVGLSPQVPFDLSCSKLKLRLTYRPKGEPEYAAPNFRRERGSGRERGWGGEGLGRGRGQDFFRMGFSNSHKFWAFLSTFFFNIAYGEKLRCVSQLFSEGFPYPLASQLK